MIFRRLAFLFPTIGLLTPAVGRAADPMIPAYAFHVNVDGLLLDGQGAPIPVADVPARIKALHLAPGTVLELLIDGPEAVGKLSATVKEFRDQFPRIVVKQWEDGAPLGAILLPPPTLKSLVAAAYPGLSYGVVNAQVDIPSMIALRPAALQPGEIPPRIRYKYVDNTTVDLAAQRLYRFLKAGAANPVHFWGRAVVVQAGAWKYLNGPGGLKPDSVTKFRSSVAIRGGTLKLEQALVRDPADLKRLTERITSFHSGTRLGEIRALRSDEMKLWWPFIGYDIVEPVLLWETTGQTHRFVFGFNRDGVGMLDDLNGLPDLTAPAP